MYSVLAARVFKIPRNHGYGNGGIHSYLEDLVVIFALGILTVLSPFSLRSYPYITSY